MYLTRRLRIYDLPSDRHLVCNALTGEVSLVGRETYTQMQALQDGRVDACSPNTLRALEERKLAFRSPADEDAAFRSLVEQAYAQYLQTSRTEYCFAVNTHCNFNCVYCFEAENLRAHASTLSDAQIDAAFRIVDREQAEQPTRPKPRFTLYGGEPLLAPSKPAVEALLRRIAERGHRTHIITNGHALASFFDVFDAYPDTVESLQITLDGIASDHDQRRVLRSGAGTFAKIADNIDAFLARNYAARCFVRTGFDKANLPRVRELKRFFDERGWSKHRRVSVVPVTIQDHDSCGDTEGLIGYADLLEAVLPYSTDTGGGPFDLSSIHVLGHVRNFLGLAAMGKAPTEFSARAAFCGAAVRLLVFHPDGRIYPCYELVGQPNLAIGRYHPEYSVDNVRREPWTGSRLLRQQECFDCTISTFCGGGCASGALAKKGTINASFCEGAHEVFDRYFGFIAQQCDAGDGNGPRHGTSDPGYLQIR